MAAVFPVAGEPTVELTRAAVTVARAQGAGVIVAIGGGSVLDTGKAVAMLLGNGGDPLDYLEVVGRPAPSPGPPYPASRCPPPRAPGRR